MDLLYGRLNKEKLEFEYEGAETDTAEVNVDNYAHTISVNVKTPSIEKLLPAIPETDGAYVLRVVIKNGEAVFEWIADTTRQVPICSEDTVCSDTLTAAPYTDKGVR